MQLPFTVLGDHYEPVPGGNPQALNKGLVQSVRQSALLLDREASGWDVSLKDGHEQTSDRLRQAGGHRQYEHMLVAG
ncbi:hypothetical protein GCM10010303_79560 [Streptomyces purpurascens]|nr:hypothetical protein GCM10010303_79560 [Streptomyces purpurascens]